MAAVESDVAKHGLTLAGIAGPSKLEEGYRPLETLSDFLMSRPVEVIVGKESKHVFFLHSELLTRESDRFRNELDPKKGFQEADSQVIQLEDEMPTLFRHFAKYLYYKEPRLALPEPSKGHVSDYVLLAELYALGERLSTSSFQDDVLHVFLNSFHQIKIPDDDICNLLEIACLEITERTKDDPLRKHIFCYAATRLDQLQKFPRFRTILRKHGELGRQIVMFAGRSVPKISQYEFEDRFEDEPRDLAEE